MGRPAQAGPSIASQGRRIFSGITVEEGGELRQMQASAASYLDEFYKHNQAIQGAATKKVREAIIALGIEIFAMVAAMVSILVH